MSTTFARTVCSSTNDAVVRYEALLRDYNKLLAKNEQLNIENELLKLKLGE